MSISLFDVNTYRAANPDLAAAGLTTDAQLLSHFQNFGLNEGRNFSALVNLNLYRASNQDLTSSGLTSNSKIFEHLQNFGVAEGRQFSPFVDLNFYRANNGDLAKFNNEQLLDHLRNFGLTESRQFSPFFDINYYRNANQDLVKAGLSGKSLLEHFEKYGLVEGRQFSNAFDIKYYRSVSSDLIAAGFNNSQLYQHFQTYGLNEGRASSSSLNVTVYLANNPDLVAAKYNNRQAYQHFLIYGQKENRPGSDYAGNTPDKARSYTSSLDNNVTFTDFVGSNDPNDYYRVTVDKLSNFTLKLDNLSSNADVQVLRNDGTTVIANSSNTGTTAELFNGTLDPGTYYIKVFSATDSNTNYNLSFSSTSPLKSAMNFGDLTGKVVNSDAVSVSTNKFDNFYRFNLTTSTKVTAAIKNLSANADLQFIWDVNKNGVVDSDDQIFTSKQDGTTQEQLSDLLPAGDNYYIRVLPIANQANYSLSLSTTQVTPVSLYNGTLSNTPDKQGYFAFGVTPTNGGTQTATNNGTNLNSIQFGLAGYSNYKSLTPTLVNSSFPTLNRANGFTVRFNVKINSESHTSDDNKDGLIDRAGFSVIAIGSDKKGIELGFWADEIWAQESTPLFTHSTTERKTNFDTKVARNYELSVLGDAYQLYADGSVILTGKVKDYSAFNHVGTLPYDPYETPNFLFFGDNTTSAAANINLQSISVLTA